MDKRGKTGQLLVSTHTKTTRVTGETFIRRLLGQRSSLRGFPGVTPEERVTHTGTP